MNVNSTAPNVFDAGLPTFTYSLTATPHDILEMSERRNRARPSPSAPRSGNPVLRYGPDILRDNRFRPPPGITLARRHHVRSVVRQDDEQPSGLDGAPHVRLRKLVSKAFTPRATSRLQDTIREVVNGLIDRVVDAGRCDVVTDLARPYPTPIMCALIGAPREDWRLFAQWTDEIFKAFNFQTDATFDESAIMRSWATGRLRRRHGRRPPKQSDR